MKSARITIATEPGCYLRMRGRPLPGLLWAEILAVLSEYRDFERGKPGTRFDPWLHKKKTA